MWIYIQKDEEYQGQFEPDVPTVLRGRHLSRTEMRSEEKVTHQ